ncbi:MULTISPECIES: ammonium transporter [unclassified Mesorhizobium]|uniref:ammonium transporter n=2 Tax=Mesorhizobium TaxID=68287 RepID=UPI000FCAD997|nr:MULTISPECIES: ammonium transporter [unclassified Mesorhizobium]RUX06907.1 ammonium transporter [Mesorhizobium sp. M8A.F.Ca.ET.023.01.1.1]TGR38583.1 ammonium transporter [bacterium M00.F.Ca.ET.199.01.1.1]TGU28047.1 ammonium transporter [bacterium M00.F.Ca.ET.156.01.1.1]TGU91166.1 ammonium transporter [Mesorhizobium sp. M00.F.Ca.ET.151.01.1.1]TGV10889.1 ammonium transporter [Mesorhizobium sp. M8A.F.Ca.ET.173.01.1.1]TGV83580.1 ammonium transporter [Mesorhizobium sp. M00.F.Ca.ET.149.01.1.1]
MNIPSTLKTTGRAALLGSLALAALGSVAAFAQEAAPAAAAAAPAAAPTPVLDTGNTAWMLTSTALVLMMTIPGLALFYGGMVRKKNVLATIMQSFAITCLVTVLWFMFGYSLAFSDGGGMNAYLGGTSKFFHHGITTASLWLPGVANIPEFVFSMFQMTFAIITPALIAGAFAERFKFSALLIFMALWLLVVYVPIAHWVWGGGFLGTAGVLDFAGGTVVHINAGVAGLVCALVLGKREGYGTTNMAPHNLVYSVIGASLLWVGWFGFNAGSELAADGLAGAAMLNTQVATAAAALAWMFAEWIIAKKPSVLGIISGAVAGLVAVTPASGFVNPTGAFIVGIVAGVVCYLSAVKVKHMFGYDDSLDAFGVHGVGGVIGALLTGVLADPAINSLSSGASLGKQIYGVAVTIIWTAVATFVILYVVKALVGLRPTTQEEVEGLDISQHGEVVP